MKTIKTKEKKNILVIVAHPDDETLWCGGTLLMYPEHHWFIACLCRKNDPDRGPKFKKVLAIYKAEGRMGNLDDSAEQRPLSKKVVKKAIEKLLPKQNFHLVLTHSPTGEYTRHLRHEEIGRAVIELWSEQKISTDELWTFAFEDGYKKYYPQAIKTANIHQTLPKSIWKEKYRIITEVYEFEKTGFEAKTTPREEAFWIFDDRIDAQKWLEHEGIQQQPT
ncbi:PIG-L deacetylase family protein [[Muricauda] lutisoli]|uniref:PIG-L family deacetylase n=1 Tax=[Muricauda] lutisoli TaxID=2816035 RepID=A0ABS3EU29_9FLAO|nr:PIG-L family deacetylase [[Muricauda] lutisoli]MBO0329713.1 PIG-L family deacetylase [[Muricauda] lutisoli]